MNDTFKSSLIGGFNKKDVLDFLADMAEKVKAEKSALEDEIRELRAENESLRSDFSEQLEKITLERDTLLKQIKEAPAECPCDEKEEPTEITIEEEDIEVTPRPAKVKIRRHIK